MRETKRKHLSIWQRTVCLALALLWIAFFADRPDAAVSAQEETESVLILDVRGAGPEVQAETETGQAARRNTDSAVQIETGQATRRNMDSTVQIETERDVDPEVQMEAETEQETKRGVDSETETKQETKRSVDSEAETERETKRGVDSETETEQETKRSAKAEVKKESETELSSEEEEIIREMLETESPVDFSSLRHKNPDIYSWIRIPGTVIDYPVLRSTGDQEFYLHHDQWGNESVYGSIFSQNINRMDYTDFLTVLYGHNMRDYSMFGSLKLFWEPSVLQKNKFIYIYLPEITLEYEIFAAYTVSADHPLYHFDQEDEKTREEYLEKVEEMGQKEDTFDRELFDTITKDSHILALYTCNGDPDHRFNVLAVLHEPPGGWTKLAIDLGLREPPRKVRIIPYIPQGAARKKEEGQTETEKQTEKSGASEKKVSATEKEVSATEKEASATEKKTSAVE